MAKISQVDQLVSLDSNRPRKTGRRRFVANLAMGGALVVSHATILGFAARFIYPNKNEEKLRIFVGVQTEMPPGSSKIFRTPGGKTINIVRGATGFTALSDICPHLGCRVHWDSRDSLFVCPCHDGRFDMQGVPVSGPPADEGKPLAHYHVEIDGNNVFIDIPMV